MQHRLSLRSFLALSAVLGFVAVGCGSSSNPTQSDAAPQTDAAPDAAPPDVAQQVDAPAQNDAGPQADASNPSGQIIITQFTAQPIPGNPYGTDGLTLATVSAGWGATPPVADTPEEQLVELNDMGLGCTAKRYKMSANKGQTFSDGKAGTVTIAGYTGGSILVPTDGGMAPGPDFPATITCSREEQVGADGGTGRYSYVCDNPGTPITGFLGASDQVTVTVTGDPAEVPGFTATGVGVAPFLSMTASETNPAALWMMAPPVGQDGGVTLDYHCGIADAGTGKPCSGAGLNVIGIRIQSSDSMPDASGLPTAPVDEWGYIECSKLGATAATSFNIPQKFWNVAFPATQPWKTLQSTVLNMTLSLENGGATLVGVGGGEFGITMNPMM